MLWLEKQISVDFRIKIASLRWFQNQNCIFQEKLRSKSKFQVKSGPKKLILVDFMIKIANLSWFQDQKSNLKWFQDQQDQKLHVSEYFRIKISNLSWFREQNCNFKLISR